MNAPLLVLGATGATGRQVVAQALQRGHSVRALARRPKALDIASPRLEVIGGEARLQSTMLAATEGTSAVLCALGTRSLRGLLLGDDLMTAAMSALLPAMSEHNVQRFVLLSALGAGESRHHAPLPARLAFSTVLRRIGRDKARAEMLLQQAPIAWTTLHPPTLTNGPATGHYRIGEDIPLRGAPKISRADVAACMLDQLDDDGHIGCSLILAP